jgi:hypothetical protein
MTRARRRRASAPDGFDDDFGADVTLHLRGLMANSRFSAFFAASISWMIGCAVRCGFGKTACTQMCPNLRR